MAFHTHEQDGLTWLSSDLLEVPHGFSTRQGGVSRPPWDSLNLGPGRGDDLDAVQENCARFCGSLGMDSARVVMAKQIHETTVRLCTPEDAGKGLYRDRDYTADALLTREPDLPLMVFSADCGTILLHDPVSKAVGAVHAGWRGCAAGIPAKAVNLLVRRFGADPARLRAALGPCIGPCCFETDGDVPHAMRNALGEAAEAYLTPQRNKWHVDLAGLNRLWLLRSGIPPEQIDVCGLCTACRPDLFWSHRKMGEARGVQAAVIMRRSVL